MRSTSPTPPVTIPQTEVHSLRSEHVGADFEVWIAHPIVGVMPFPFGPRKVLYVLDADLCFGTAVGMTRIMSQLYGELPPIVVVGVAYPAGDFALHAEVRTRDFTPTDDAGFAKMAVSLPGAPEPTLPEGERMGGATRFLKFLQDEVRPLVEERVDVADGSSTLFGSSLGGLFVLHTLLSETQAFDAYIAVSPALWWDADVVLNQEAELATTSNDLAARVVLAVGGLEEDPRVPMLAEFKMVTNVQTLEERLLIRDYPSLQLNTFVLDGESHTSVVPVALTRALRVVYPPAWRSG